MKPLLALALLASALVALVVRLRRDAKAWAEWDADPNEHDEHEAGVPMTADIATALRAAHAGPSSVDSWRVAVRDPKHETTYTWPYRGEVS